MTVANGGNAIEDRRSVGFVRLGPAKAVFFLCVLDLKKLNNPN